MLPTVSTSQAIYRIKDNLTKPDFLHIATEASEGGENYDNMFSRIQNPADEIKTLKTSKAKRGLIDITKDVSTQNNARLLSSVFCGFVKTLAFLLYEKNNLHKEDNLVFHLTKTLLKVLSDKSFTELIENSCNLEDSLKLSDVIKYLRPDFSYEQFLKTRFYPIFWEMTNWNISSNNLIKEIILNTHFASNGYLPAMEMQNLLNKINSSVSKNDFIQQPSRPALKFVDEDSNKNHKLNLLCVFTNEVNCKDTTSNFNEMNKYEDIKMILPMTWNIVVAYNVLTISDENNHITIFFRNPLEAKFDYKYSNLSLSQKFRFKSSMEMANKVQSGRMRKLNSPHKVTATADKDIKPFNMRKSPKQVRENKTKSDSFLLLREPILLNCIEQNKRKQVLMYKAHSVENMSKVESSKSFYKILDELLSKSVEYEDQPVHLVFEPLKLINRLKKNEKISGLNVAHNTKCNHNLIESRIYKKLRYKRAQIFRDTHRENEAFRTVLPKNASIIQVKNTSEMPGKSVITSHSYLDRLKNFDTSITRKNVDMNECTIQGEYASEPIITTHSCSDLPKNFRTSVTRKQMDIEELFQENKSKLKFRRRMYRTELKQVNVKQIVSSVFRHFFHFYSLHGGNLRSGAVITRSNSNYWLQVAGVATDSCTLRLAGDLFETVAGRKVVLNIFDYIKFLAVFARTRRLIICELVNQMLVFEQLSEPIFSMDKCKKCTTLKNPENEPKAFCSKDNHLTISQSLPNMWNTNFKVMPSNVNTI